MLYFSVALRLLYHYHVMATCSLQSLSLIRIAIRKYRLVKAVAEATGNERLVTRLHYAIDQLLQDAAFESLMIDFYQCKYNDLVKEIESVYRNNPPDSRNRCAY